MPITINNNQSQGSGVGKIRHFIGERKNDWYKGSDFSEVASQGRVSNIYKSAVIAKPGEVVPKVFGTAPVQGRVIWASEKYFESNGKPVIDIAYSLCEGEINGVLRIYAGTKLIYSPDDIRGTLSGGKFWKKFTIHNGSLTQDKDITIKSHEGEEDTPNYHGLCYVVFKGLKLYRFGNSAPDLYFVVNREVQEVLADEYDYIYYPNTFAITSIDGIPGEDFVYVSSAGRNVFKVELSTNTWTDLGSGGSTTKVAHSVAVINNKIYQANFAQLAEYSGTGTIWNTIDNYSGSGLYCVANSNRNLLVYNTNNDPFTFNTPRTYNGSSVTLLTGFSGVEIKNISGFGIADDGIIWGKWSASAGSGVFRFWDGLNWTNIFTSLNLAQSLNCKIAFDRDNNALIAAHNTIGDDEYKLVTLNQMGLLSTESIEFTSTTSFSPDVDFFQNKVHFCHNQLDNPHILRREGLNDWVQLSIPDANFSNIRQTNILKKIGTKLYCGTNRGFFQVGDV